MSVLLHTFWQIVSVKECVFHLSHRPYVYSYWYPLIIILMSVVMVPLSFMIAFIYFLDYSSCPFSNFVYIFKELAFDSFISITFVFFYIGFPLRIVIYCFHFEFILPSHSPVLNLMSLTLDFYFLLWTSLNFYLNTTLVALQTF